MYLDRGLEMHAYGQKTGLILENLLAQKPEKQQDFMVSTLKQKRGNTVERFKSG